MKKMILFIVYMLFIPLILTFVFSLCSDDIQIGGGGNSLKNKYLGKQVLMEINGLYKSMDVEEYVLGILPGTIPADYDKETLMVQAVLIRTNVLKEIQEKGTSDAADLSYQYLTVEDQIRLWGEQKYAKNKKKMEEAVARTAGNVIEQENSLIMALYHEVSIGKTASAQEILGEDISYLQSVESGQDVEAKHYMNLVTYTWSELSVLLNESNIQKEGETSEDKEEITEQEKKVQDIVNISIDESSENGFVKKVSVNGTVYTGEEAMNLFHLSSTNFYVEEVEGGIRFVCLGKGNCLGVSQYGANRMALNGSNMEEIIRYYYPGVSLTVYGK